LQCRNEENLWQNFNFAEGMCLRGKFGLRSCVRNVASQAEHGDILFILEMTQADNIRFSQKGDKGQ
jgi:hypothetical protein